MFTVGQRIIDSRSNKIADIVDIVNNERGTLYTVQFETGQYRRYYATKFNEIFRDTGEIVLDKDLASDLSNVIPVDFKRRCRVA